jgi:hypothetical protein
LIQVLGISESAARIFLEAAQNDRFEVGGLVGVLV